MFLTQGVVGWNSFGESVSPFLAIQGFSVFLTQYLHHMLQVWISHENNGPHLRATRVTMILVNFNHRTKSSSTKNKNFKRQLVDGEERGGL